MLEGTNEHIPVEHENWKGTGETFLRCSCRRLSVNLPPDKVAERWDEHLIGVGVKPKPFAPKPAPVAKTAPSAKPPAAARPRRISSGGARGPYREYVRGPLSSTAITKLWKIWDLCAEASGFEDGRSLIAAKHSRKAWPWRSLALVLCRSFPGGNDLYTARELGLTRSSLFMAEKAFQDYLISMPQLADLAHDIAEKLHFELPQRLFEPPAEAHSTAGYRVTLPETRAKAAKAVFSVITGIIGEELKGRTQRGMAELYNLAVALAAAAASDCGDLLTSTALQEALAKVLVLHQSTVQRAIKAMPDILADNPALNLLARAVLHDLRMEGIEVYLPPKWKQLLD